MPRRRFLPGSLGLFLACTFLGPGTSLAQISVQAGLTPGKISLGDHAQLTVQVRGASQLPAQPVISIEGVDVEPSGIAQNTSIDGSGKVQVMVSYSYLLSAEKVGDYPIPAQSITVEGNVYQTTPLLLKVVEGSSTADQYQPILKLEAGKTEVYEGEVIPLTITLMVHRNTNITEPPNIQLPREGFAMKRFQRNPDQAVEQSGGNIYQVLHYRTSINAIKSGTLTLGPAEAKVELLVPDGSGRRDPFGGMNARQRSFKVVSEPQTIVAKPLPAAGKPDNFNGAVGNFTLQIQAQPLKLVEGDPIAATLYISGTGNFESLTAPEMESSEGWRLYPAKLVQENRNSGLEPGGVAFSQVLIPDRVHPKLPPFVLHFFNPESGQYVTAKTEALPLQISPNPQKAVAAQTGAESASNSGIRDFTFQSKDTPAENLQGTLTISRSSGTLFPLAATAFTGIPPLWVHGVGGGLCLGLLGWSLRKRWKQRARPKETQRSAPPKATDLLRQLRSERASLRTFYALADEFLTAWSREHQHPLPATVAATEAIQRIRLRRSFYCYGAEPQADQPVPESEHQEILQVLKDF